MNKVPCICGHIKDEHVVGSITNETFCFGCVIKPATFEYELKRGYHNFKSDNLKYIQQLYTKRPLWKKLLNFLTNIGY